MALNTHILVNKQPIGYVGIQRVEGAMGGDCVYRYVIDMEPHPLTGERVMVEGDGVEHHYNDSPLDLIRKVLDHADGQR